MSQLASRYAGRLELATAYEAAYRRYSWPVASVSDLRLATFHLQATEGRVHVDRDDVWHMETLAEVRRVEPSDVPFATPYKEVDVTNLESEAAAIAWWKEMTGRGGEGMVVKPCDFIATGGRGLVQPAVKCRGREYLRIIYGPEYTLPENLERLRNRGSSGSSGRSR